MSITENKLVKKLSTSQEELEKQMSEDVYNRMNTLLLTSGDESEKVLDALSLDRTLKVQKELNEEIFRSKKSRETYKTHTFSGRLIKELCNTYYLKILPTSYYNGPITSELPRKVKQFCDMNNLKLEDVSNNFFILAPIELFKTQKMERPKKDPDPILFYRPTEKGVSSRDNWGKVVESDTLVQVYNWGSDFSESRRFKYLFNTTINSNNSDSLSMMQKMFIAMLIFLFPIVFFISSFPFLFTFSFLLFSSFILYKVGISKCYADDLWNVEKI